MRTGVRAALITTAAACTTAIAPAGAPAATISSSTATPLVDNFLDDGICSLREMVQIANTDNATVEPDCTVIGTPGDDSITLGAGTYQVNTAGGEDATPDDNVQGDLDIGGMGNLAIIGAGQATTLINEAGGMPGTRVMEVTAGDLDLTDLTVTGGTSVAPTDAINGGGILFGSAGTLEVLRTSFTSNVTAAGGDGGAINNTGGTTVVRDSDLVGNNASDSGGGIRGFNVTVSEGSLIQNNTGSGGGGGVTGSGAFSLADSTVDNNHVTNASDGGGLLLTAPASTNLTIDRSRIINNDTAGDGGGIYATPGATNTLAINDTLIQDNEATSATGFVEGGGIRVANGTTTIDSSVVRSNEARHTGTTNGGIGGGIVVGTGLVASTLRVADSAIVGNAASTTDDVAQVSGGGIQHFDGTTELRRSTVSGNTLSGPSLGGQQFGGGIAIGPNQGSLLLLNSTVSDNTAPKLPAVGAGRGGGIFASDTFGAADTTVQVILSTIAGNTAGDAAGLGDPGDGITIEGTATAAVRGSLIQAANGDEACEPTLTSGGRNVTSDSACFAAPGAGDLQGADPLLAALADNGGPLIGAPGALERLQTQALLAGSPALDRVPAAECTNEVPAPVGTDERGVPRPQGAACDSGAYELFVPVAAAPVAAENPECEPLRQKIRRLSRKIKRADDPAKKAKLKKKRRKARKQLAALGCP